MSLIQKNKNILIILLAVFNTQCVSKENADLEKSCLDGEVNRCEELQSKYFRNSDFKDARSLYERACIKGTLDICLDLGIEKSVLLPGVLNKYINYCEEGRLDVCFKLAKHWERTEEKKTTEFYNKACGGGYLRACSALGLIQFKLNNNSKMARKNFKKACDGGETKGCVGLGKIEEMNKNINSANIFFEKACAGGEKEGCISLPDIIGNKYFNLYSSSPLPFKKMAEAAFRNKNYELEREHFKMDCYHENFNSCLKAKTLKDEMLVQASDVKLYENGCQQNVQGSCFSLGVLEKKKGKSKEAINYFQSSCDQNYIVSCFHLAMINLDADMVPGAQNVFKKLCDNKNADGCFYYGLNFIGEIGSNEKQNKIAKKNLVSKACSLGSIGACYFQLESRNKNDVDSSEDDFIKSACDSGYQNACGWDKRRHTIVE